MNHSNIRGKENKQGVSEKNLISDVYKKRSAP